jgi:autotransporter-associated beta strand protein
MDRVLGYFGVIPDLPLTVAAGQIATDAVARSGPLRLVKRGGGRLVIDRVNTFTGGTVIEEGEVVLRNPAGLGTAGIEVRNGARLTIDCGYGRVNLPALALTAGGRIDVGAGGIVIAAGTASVAAVRQQVVAGRGQGDWASTTTGIGSTAAGPGSNRTVGMLVQNDGSILVACAAPGDIDLDGFVDIADIAALMGSGLFDTGLAAAWWEGDITYDGVVDSLDLGEMLGSGLFDGGNYRT